MDINQEGQESGSAASVFLAEADWPDIAVTSTMRQSLCQEVTSALPAATDENIPMISAF